MKESDIEKFVCNFAKDKNWLVYKFVSPGCRGVPDRIFMKDGEMFFVEFKQPGGKLSALQHRRIKDIAAAGFHVYVIANIELGEKLFS